MGKMGISFAIGGSIAAVIMVIGIFSLATDTISTSTTASMSLVGHYDVTVYDSDGNVKAYIQTDNALTDELRNCLWDNYFLTTLAAGACVIGTPEIGVGDGLFPTVPNAASGGLVNEYTSSGRGTAVLQASTASAGANTPSVVWSNQVGDGGTAITISQTDLSASTSGRQSATADTACVDEGTDGLDDCEIDEVALFDGSGAMLSHATLAKTLVSTGDTVGVRLTISIT